MCLPKILKKSGKLVFYFVKDVDRLINSKWIERNPRSDGQVRSGTPGKELGQLVPFKRTSDFELSASENATKYMSR